MKQKTDKQRLNILKKIIESKKEFSRAMVGEARAHQEEQIDALEWAIYALEGKDYVR